MALLKRARRLSDAAHAVEKVLTTTAAAAAVVTAAEAAASSTSTAQQVDDPPPATTLLPKLLAAAPHELRPRLEGAAAAAAEGDTPGAEFAQTVLAALPRVEVVGVVEEEEEEEGELGARRLRDTVVFVAVDGGLKDELFVELMAMMSHAWFARVWEGEGEGV